MEMRWNGAHDFMVEEAEEERHAEALEANKKGREELVIELKQRVLVGTERQQNVLKAKERNLKFIRIR
jgi:hypothetical protein